MNLTPGVRNLLFINIGLFLVPELLGRHDILVELLGLHFFNSMLFNPMQIVSHMFLHGSFMHLLFNMLGLVMFGTWLERVWGMQRFLLFYFVCGIGAGLMYMGINYFQLSAMIDARDAFVANPHPDDLANFIKDFYSNQYRTYIEFIEEYGKYPNNPQLKQDALEFVTKLTSNRVNAPMIGASGAIFGILLAYGMMFPNAELMVFPIPIPIKAKYLVIFYGCWSLYSALNQSEGDGDNVAHLAHLGGMFWGYIMMRVYKKW
jgi:membrane associated rhomboid family serine protease